MLWSAWMLISDDSTLLDVDAIHGFLSGCYWSPGIARERVERAIRHSLCWGVYDPSVARRGLGDGRATQVGFARVVTDQASFAYLCDVFVVEEYRGRGLAKALMRAIMDDPRVGAGGLRRFCLMTRDAHGLYESFGFRAMADPSRYLEIVDREGYKKP